LVAKAVRSYGLRQRGADLLIPLYLDGRLVNLQRIAPDGDKRFLFGGRIKGTYSPMGIIEPGSVLCICEGWATAASLHQHGGYVVAAAMNAGNLIPAAMALRARYPGQPIVIAGDDDRLTMAIRGAQRQTRRRQPWGGQVAFPEWPEGAPDDLTDFNDLANWKLAHVQA